MCSCFVFFPYFKLCVCLVHIYCFSRLCRIFVFCVLVIILFYTQINNLCQCWPVLFCNFCAWFLYIADWICASIIYEGKILNKGIAKTGYHKSMLYQLSIEHHFLFSVWETKNRWYGARILWRTCKSCETFRY